MICVFSALPIHIFQIRSSRTRDSGRPMALKKVVGGLGNPSWWQRRNGDLGWVADSVSTIVSLIVAVVTKIATLTASEKVFGRFSCNQISDSISFSNFVE